MAKNWSYKLGRRLLVGPLAAVILAGVLVMSTVRLGATDTDTDRDGLPDVQEIAGWSDEKGRLWNTDPQSADTDGDGLDDGFEAGPVADLRSRSEFRPHRLWSNPVSMDSDEDGLADGAELVLDTDPQEDDSDGDALSDGAEIDLDFDPTNSNADGDQFDDGQEQERGSDPFLYDLTRAEAAAALLAGAAAGDWQWLARRAGLNDAQLQSAEYLGGQLLAGVLAVADLRDIAAQLRRGDYVGAAISSAGVVPGPGDAAKSIKLVRSFASQSATANRAARGFVEGRKWPKSLKAMLLRGISQTEARGLPLELRGGPKTSQLYVGRAKDGSVSYCGITNDFERRRAEHRDRFELVAVAQGLNRGEARALEQACVLRLRDRGTGPLNVINSINPRHTYYRQAVDYGSRRLDALEMGRLLDAG